MSVDAIADPPLPLQANIPSYLYQQYADDENLQAFVDAYNSIQQGMLDWFNNTPLAVYANPNISGPLLDWIATGIYGISRPVFSSLRASFVAGVNSAPINAVAINGAQTFTSGSATVATDDYYKRVLAWWTYIGNGRYFNIPLLRLKVARFLYGGNGADVTLDQAQTVHIAAGLALPAAPTLSYTAGGSLPETTYAVRNSYVTAGGESLAGPAASLTVPASHLLVVDSAAAQNGAIGWNPYVATTNAPPFRAGVNALAVNSFPVNGSYQLAYPPPTRQATSIGIGTNWTEPTTGLIEGEALPTTETSNTSTNFIITVPAGTSSSYFQQAIEQGILAFPFLYSATVVIS